MKKSLLLCWQADIKSYDKALRQKVETEMSYSTNNTASNKTSKILLEFKIKIKGLLPGGYQTSSHVSLTTKIVLTVTVTDAWLLPVNSTWETQIFCSLLNKSEFLISCPFLQKKNKKDEKQNWGRLLRTRQALESLVDCTHDNGKINPGKHLRQTVFPSKQMKSRQMIIKFISNVKGSVKWLRCLSLCKQNEHRLLTSRGGNRIRAELWPRRGAPAAAAAGGPGLRSSKSSLVPTALLLPFRSLVSF